MKKALTYHLVRTQRARQSIVDLSLLSILDEALIIGYLVLAQGFEL